MAIKTVNAENLVEFVKNRPDPTKVQSPQAVADALKGSEPTQIGVVGEGEESISTAPKPEGKPEEPKKPKDGIDARLKKVTEDYRELDEAFQEEYERRLKLEGELTALKATAKPPEPEKPKGDPRPDRTMYTEAQATEYENDLLAWNRREARREYEAEQRERDQERAARDAEAAMVKKIAKAKADLEDFDDVIDKADRRTRADLKPHIKAAIYESEVGAHLAYELAKDEDLERRISAMTPARALLALGKLEEKYLKKTEKEEVTPRVTVGSNLEPRPPEPVTKLKESSGIVQTDLSQPMDFKSYRRVRLDQLREKRRR